ncbi:translation initiation factor eIF-3 subunit 1 [Exophiala viscosa]|uniref:Eukaryotic translation initiation factor 3 subunit J n=1 Tax=Exophiala viscosa TaxID=2486360 RepID=A0AAN6IEM4_9EURO|nr:translation initiation factor eIF-3 subunit 1 [Exophiala viscosa]
MPPSKWDDESEESSDEESVDVPVAVPVATRRKFDDEEDSDDVADNWEEEEDSEVEREKAAKAAAAKAKADAEAAANKKPKSQRIEEHREAARRRRAEEEDDEDSSDEDEAEKRARLRQTEQDADLKHAQDLFAGVGMGPKSRSATNKAVIIEDKENPGQTIDLSTLPLFKASTKTQFDALSATLVPLLIQLSSKPHYAIWVPNFVKQVCADLPSTEIKKAASALTALSNEKLKEEKAQDKGGKKSKAAKTKTTLAATRDIGRGAADTTSYDDAGLEEDDFM